VRSKIFISDWSLYAGEWNYKRFYYSQYPCINLGNFSKGRIERGEFKQLTPLNTPDIETKLAALAPDERELVTKFLESCYPVEKKN